MGPAIGHLEKASAGVVPAASSAVRCHSQVTTLKVLFCFLLSPLALMGLVSSVLLRNEEYAQLLVWIPSLELTAAESVTDGDLWYEMTKGIQDSL